MITALSQEQADELVRRLELDGEVDDYELVGDKHTYFLERPQALLIDLAGRACIVDVDSGEDTGRVVTVGSRAPHSTQQPYIVDGWTYVVDLARL